MDPPLYTASLHGDLQAVRSLLRAHADVHARGLKYQKTALMAAANKGHTEAVRELLAEGARLDAVFFCPHTPEDQCDCRKPKPGLLQDIGRRYGNALQNVPVVGDTLRDLQAASAAGCEPHLVLSGRASGLTPLEDLTCNHGHACTAFCLPVQKSEPFLIVHDINEHLPSAGYAKYICTCGMSTSAPSASLHEMSSRMYLRPGGRACRARAQHTRMAAQGEGAVCTRRDS
jgi:hypothetical protein